MSSLTAGSHTTFGIGTLPRVSQPVRILWGENDPWEPLELGYQYADKARYPCVDEFVVLPGAGHCPMDQVPDRVNEEILRFLRDHSNKGGFPTDAQRD